MFPSVHQVFYTETTEARAVKQPGLLLATTATNINLSRLVTLAAFELEAGTNIGPAVV